MPKIEKVKVKKKKSTALVKKAVKTKKIKPSSVEYYNCLLTQAQNDWYDPNTGRKQKITACCKNCKANAPALSKQRDLELEKLVTSYRQVGESLSILLKPIK